MTNSSQEDIIALERKLLEREEKIELKQEKIAALTEQVEKKREEYIEKLEKASGLTRDEAKREILLEAEKFAAQMVARIIKEKEEEAKYNADKKAQEILLDSMKHGALNFIPEHTVSMVKVPEEEMKGRIIGKEGRNIRAFEQATGVDVDLDEEGIIRLSSFDQIRREVARRSLEKLLKDTRVQPFRIEEVVKETRKELEKIMLEEGEKLAASIDVYNLPTDLYPILGRMKFRTSYGQNLLVHTLEEAKIGIHIAAELGADANIVRLACLFHDIGKVLEGEGSHVKLGVELLKKHNLPEAIIDCVEQHHEDKPFTSVESIIVHIADAISAMRPLARYEELEKYTERLQDMEKIAKKYEGVEDAFAFQAGRELRVIVDPGKMDDSQTTLIARKIQEEVSRALAVPGEVKVTAIREFRATFPEAKTV
ncbi:ribonuclease Y [Patescibacteria group bacterium]|nr:ribonuclease Y [Patescibacteria group bacterium]MBU4098068.1 ribonuclease Y [Patescibacteria group bacterium]